MDAAKEKVKSFLTKGGQHDTTVHETVAPAVTHETVNKTEHERVVTALDKEVHQDHYHTSIQPVKDSAVLPTQHHHNVLPVEHRQVEHNDESKVQNHLETEASKFQDKTVRVEGQSTASVQPVAAAEHVHHHVHEKIQPIVQKETVEPHVIHTTVPIHEVHHNAAQVHSATALPAVSMDEFKAQGGSLAGRGERQDGFKGEPRSEGRIFAGENKQ